MEAWFTLPWAGGLLGCVQFLLLELGCGEFPHPGARAAVPVAVVLKVGSQAQQLSTTWKLAGNANSWASDLLDKKFWF